MNIQIRLNKIHLIIPGLLLALILIVISLTEHSNPAQAQGGTTIFLPIILKDSDMAPRATFYPTILDVPTDEPLACERPWTVRLLRNSNKFQYNTRRMYFSSCSTDSGSPEMFASFTVGDKDSGHPDISSGVIMHTQFMSTTNQFDLISERHFPECTEMLGIQSSNSCGLVAALCRTDWGRTDFDKDVVETHPGDHWLTEEEHNGSERDQIWLYEWPSGNIQDEPDKYIVHKAIGSWEYGQQYLVYGENDNSYGISVKATHGGHEGDSFVIVDRDDFTIDTSRGWDWGCATGHTLFNRPAYNPATQEYGVLCGTDWNTNKDAYIGSITFATQHNVRNEFQRLNRGNLAMKGGPGSLVPLADGGWLAVFVSQQGTINTDSTLYIPWSPSTKIGLARFDQAGNLVDSIKWVVDLDTQYASYPQLVALENGNYLLGYGEMMADETDPSVDWYWDYNQYVRFPEKYWIQEIDIDGNAVTAPHTLSDAGWGELDQLVSLGNNRVGWAYLEEATLSNTAGMGGPIPECNVDKLQFTAAVSPNSQN